MAKRRWKVYSLHTLDGAAALLNSNKHFPSRVSVKESSVQCLQPVSSPQLSHEYFTVYAEYTYVRKYDVAVTTYACTVATE